MVTTEHEKSRDYGAEVHSRRDVQTPALDLVLLLAAHARFVVLTTLSAMLLAFALTFLIKPTYTAIAMILPPQTPQSSLTAMLGQLGSLAGLGGSSPLKNPADLYIGILQSRSVRDQVIAHFHLQQQWHLKTLSAARGVLADTSEFESTKDGMIQISVKQTDPLLASEIANFYVNSLGNVNSSMAVTEAAQRRLFFEQQLDAEKTTLSNAEEDLKKTQQKTGLLTVPGQTELAVRNVAQTRAQISSLEVQLQGLRTFDADENPDVLRIEQQLRALRAQLAAQESSVGNSAAGNPEISTGQVPEGGLEYARKLREVKYNEILFDLLSRQYEAARIDEAKSSPIIQVIDHADPPELASGPRRKLIVVGVGCIGFVLACMWALYRGALSQARRQPVLAEKLLLLQSFLPWFPF